MSVSLIFFFYLIWGKSKKKIELYKESKKMLRTYAIILEKKILMINVINVKNELFLI